MNDNIYEMARDNNIDEIKLLIEAGEDLNKKDEFGWTPLHLAISKKHEKLALMLLEKGADPSIQDNNGFNAIHYVAGNNMFNVAKNILGKTPELLKIENSNGTRPLWIAVHNAKRPFNMIKLFLEKGADKDHGDNTALDRAKLYNIDEVVELFEGY